MPPLPSCVASLARPSSPPHHPRRRCRTSPSASPPPSPLCCGERRRVPAGWALAGAAGSWAAVPGPPRSCRPQPCHFLLFQRFPAVCRLLLSIAGPLPRWRASARLLTPASSLPPWRRPMPLSCWTCGTAAASPPSCWPSCSSRRRTWGRAAAAMPLRVQRIEVGGQAAEACLRVLPGLVCPGTHPTHPASGTSSPPLCPACSQCRTRIPRPVLTLALAPPAPRLSPPPRLQSTMAQLEAGDLKLRVRVLEAERADRRSGVIQVRLS